MWKSKKKGGFQQISSQAVDPEAPGQPSKCNIHNNSNKHEFDNSDNDSGINDNDSGLNDDFSDDDNGVSIRR
jgi:hypothetical protein